MKRVLETDIALVEELIENGQVNEARDVLDEMTEWAHALRMEGRTSNEVEAYDHAADVIDEIVQVFCDALGGWGKL